MTPSRLRLAFFVAAYLAIILQSEKCRAVLIDDFSINQAGFSTGQNAAFDTVLNSGLWSGRRIVWGGGSSAPGACAECDIAANITDDRFQVIPGADCPGAGNVSWGQGANGAGMDLTGASGIAIDVAELTGTAHTRIGITSGSHLSQRRESYLDIFLSSVGVRTVAFSELSRPVILSDINSINISTGLDAGEYVAFDSVFAVPEPTSMALVALSVVMLSAGRMSRRK